MVINYWGIFCKKLKLLFKYFYFLHGDQVFDGGLNTHKAQLYFQFLLL